MVGTLLHILVVLVYVLPMPRPSSPPVHFECVGCYVVCVYSDRLHAVSWQASCPRAIRRGFDSVAIFDPTCGKWLLDLVWVSRQF
jgi:hypothetical protein